MTPIDLTDPADLINPCDLIGPAIDLNDHRDLTCPAVDKVDNRIITLSAHYSRCEAEGPGNFIGSGSHHTAMRQGTVAASGPFRAHNSSVTINGASSAVYYKSGTLLRDKLRPSGFKKTLFYKRSPTRRFLVGFIGFWVLLGFSRVFLN